MAFKTECAKTTIIIFTTTHQIHDACNLLSTDLLFSPGFGDKWKLEKYAFKKTFL